MKNHLVSWKEVDAEGDGVGNSFESAGLQLELVILLKLQHLGRSTILDTIIIFRGCPHITSAAGGGGVQIQMIADEGGGSARFFDNIGFKVPNKCEIEIT